MKPEPELAVITTPSTSIKHIRKPQEQSNHCTDESRLFPHGLFGGFFSTTGPISQTDAKVFHFHKITHNVVQFKLSHISPFPVDGV